MKWTHKVALIAGGYVLCFLMAAAFVAIHIASAGESPGQAGGMNAFGDTVLFIGVFGVSAVVPTGLALLFLRPYRPFWNMFAAAGITLAGTGAAAATIFAVGGNAAVSRFGTWGQVSVLRILVSPLLALTFVACAILSPHQGPRRGFFTAGAVEAAVSIYGWAVWIVPWFMHRV
jgi:hypothetical protein